MPSVNIPIEKFPALKESVGDSFLTPGVQPVELELEFNQLAQQWYQETRMLSFVRQKALHPAYQQIIGMGTSALPFIFRELKKSGADWLWALESISRKINPASGMTNFNDAVAAWLKWGKQQGYIK